MVLPTGSRDLAQVDRDLAGLADRWAIAVRQTGFIPLTGPDLADHLAEQVRRLAAALVADPFCDEPGYEVGAALVSAGLTSEATLHRTVAVLSELPVVAGGDEARLSGRMAALLGAVAGGFTRAVRERTVLEQERIRLAALNAARTAQRSGREREARLRAMFDSAGVAIAISDLDGNLVEGNPALARMLGVPVADLLGRPMFDLFPPDDAAAIRAEVRERLTAGGDQVRAEKRFLRADGRVGWMKLTISLVRAHSDEPGYLVAMAEDVTETHRLQDQLHHQAHHDPLTGLPNRTLLWQRLTELLGHATPQSRLGLCFLDLDRFKVVNDTLGHCIGDQLLVAVADRLHSCVRDAGHFIARVGGDEFVVILYGTSGPQEPIALTETMLAALRPGFPVDGQHLIVSASIGIVEQPAFGADPEEILRAADATLYWAKADGRDRWALFDAERSARQQLRYGLTARLPAALEAGELALEYQPIVALAAAGAPSGTAAGIRGAEALLRWHHPELGTLSPGTFMPVAEQTGLIVPLGRWVLRQACAQAAQWQERLATPPFVSVNLSTRQCADPQLLDDVAEVLRATGLRPGSLQLELTETAVMAPHAPPVAVLRALADLGVRIAIDDFGVGYSNLAQLRQLPVHGLKLAGAFMAGVRSPTSGRVDERIVAAVVNLAHTLNLTVTAEGVEDAEQAARLAAVGCDLAQGWHFGRPASAETVELLAAAADPA